MKALIVDDDRELADLLNFAFARAGFEALVAHDSPRTLQLFDSQHPDIVILDINLGAWNGLDILRELRRRDDPVPVIMLTALDGEEDKIKGLELGADDYVTKPFSHRELLARVRAHLRGRGHEVPETDVGPRELEVGPLGLNTGEHSVILDGKPVELTVTEFRLLYVLMREAGNVVPTRTVLRQVWGYNDLSATDVVRVTVHRLRRKLGDDAAQPRLLHTIPGVGVMVKVGPLKDVPAA